METEIISTSLEAVRRLAISKQFLSGNAPEGPLNNRIKTIIRSIGYIQWDLVTVVAPSHIISIWSRIGRYDWSVLDKMMWNDKEILLHSVPTAWIVLAEDYSIFYSLMKRYPDSMRRGWASHVESAKKFLDSHKGLRQNVIRKLEEGPAETSQFKRYGRRTKSPDGWGTGSEVGQLLFHLQMTGEVMVSGHSGKQNVWSLADQFLPGGIDRTIIPQDELEKKTAERALKAMGAATERDIFVYFIRGRYIDIKGTMKQLLDDGTVITVRVDGKPGGKQLYLLSEDRNALDSIMKDKWEPRLNLISPFDNIITLRDRTKRVFNFDYKLEQFAPKDKRIYGTYVLPIMWGSNLVGRIDVKMDRNVNSLIINSVFAEPGFEGDSLIGEKLQEKIEEFASFLGTERIVFGAKKPEKWSRYLAQ